MDSIDKSGHPLAYKVVQDASLADNLPQQTHTLQTAVRALEGMQKEAIVTDASSGTVWRLVSDEGPYLNGTDLAPFPLAFFTTGMALSFTEAFLQQAQQLGVTIHQYQLTQDNRYTMEGSAIRGDMIGGALPVEMLVEVESDANQEQIQAVAAAAKKASPAQALLQQALTNTFSLQHNGRDTAVTSITPSPHSPPPDPTPQFSNIPPLPDNTYTKDIITKQKTAETLFGVEGGAGSSLQAAQKRILHVRGICTIRPDGLKQVDVQLFKPIGSTFRFLGDNSDKECAPSSLVYLSAGIGFCFMTQIGRYAHITKQALHAYSIVQQTRFNTTAHPVDTHVYLTSDEPDEVAQKTVAMSERTCFLHAAMRQTTDTNITVL